MFGNRIIGKNSKELVRQSDSRIMLIISQRKVKRRRTISSMRILFLRSEESSKGTSVSSWTRARWRWKECYHFPSSKYNVYHPFPISELYKSRTLKQLVEEARWEVTPLLTKSYSWSSFTSPVPPRFFLTSILPLPSYAFENDRALPRSRWPT